MPPSVDLYAGALDLKWKNFLTVLVLIDNDKAVSFSPCSFIKPLPLPHVLLPVVNALASC